MDWTFPRRAQALKASFIRDLLKVTTRPEVVSFAGGLPAPDAFPVEHIRTAYDRVLSRHGRVALQYGPSDGYLPLRADIAALLSIAGSAIHPGQVLMVSGSQQAFDLVGKVLLDEDSRVLVETPTYLGALQSFSLYSQHIEGVETDDGGVLPHALQPASLLYVQPNFRNPTGQSMPALRREQLAEASARLQLPLVEDNPYNDLCFSGETPVRLLNLHAEGVIYLGSFSKSLAPGIRLGYVVAPPALAGKLEKAKQATDLHTAQLTQMVVYELLRDGFAERRRPCLQALYRQRCEDMLQALEEFFPQGTSWTRPGGGMFIWVTLPAGVDSIVLLEAALKENVAFVPGSPFHPGNPRANTLRLSFATESQARMREGIARLGRLLHSLP